jgi:hypothetical protein
MLELGCGRGAVLRMPGRALLFDPANAVTSASTKRRHHLQAGTDR